jgi:hypothetical protein
VDAGVSPYPPEVPGEKIRQIPFPCERPGPRDRRMKATRPDGTEYDIRRSLGLPSVPPADDDQGVRWTAWP